MFTCYNQDDTEKKGTCRFKEVSLCRDHVSKYICNGHAELFGITYKLQNYLDANNNAWSRIISYICSSSSFNLPLFVEESGEISISEIHSFALSVCATHPNIKKDAFKNAIACLMGINAYESNCDCEGWLDDDSAKILVQKNNDISTLSGLPTLHKILFHYSKPSFIFNISEDSQLYMLPTISLQYDISSFQFRVPNKDTVLKWTSQPNCVATPIVLNAMLDIKPNDKLRSFKPICKFNI